MEISNTLCGDIVNYIKMLINKNEAKASEGEEEDVELVEDVQNNEIAVVPSKTENDCRKKRQSAITDFFRKNKYN